MTGLRSRYRRAGVDRNEVDRDPGVVEHLRQQPERRAWIVLDDQNPHVALSLILSTKPRKPDRNALYFEKRTIVEEGNAMFRINRRKFLIGGASTLALPVAARAEGEAAEPPVGDNGLHVQPWFHESFLDMADDLSEAKAEGKHLAVIFEQRGCPYCREMHRVNLARPEIADYIKEHYYVVQLDLWGSREVTDFDGEALEERALARKWRVTYTPTIAFFSNEADLASKQDGRDLETARMPGYFKPYHFLSMFEYVAEGHWKTEHFQKFIQAKFDKLKEEGKSPDIWN